MAVNPHEKAMQRALIQYRNPKNYDLVYEALTKAGRTDLIGFDKKCLIRPRRIGAQSGDNRTHGGNKAYADGGRRNDNRVHGGKNNTAAAKKKTIRNVHKKK
mgnify:FL=1